MLRFRPGIKRETLPFFIALLCCFTIAPRRASPAGSGPRELFTDEEKVVQAALREEFQKMGARCRILRGTILYLMRPHRSKYYNINSLGFRGEEVKAKGENGVSIVMMGGSAVFGDTTKSDSQTIPAYLEELLREKHPDMDIRVHNLGIPGYIFQREIALAKRFSEHLDPDLIIFYNGANDLTCAYYGGYIRYQPFDKEDETFFIKKQNENWGLEFQGMVRSALRRVRGGIKFRPAQYIPQKVDSFVKGYLRDARDVREYFQLHEIGSKKKIPVLFVLQPTLSTRKNRTPREQKLVDSFKYPNFMDCINQCVAKLSESAQSEGVGLHDFTGVFDGNDGEFFSDEAHMNIAGNQIIAERLMRLVEVEAGFILGRAD